MVEPWLASRRFLRDKKSLPTHRTIHRADKGTGILSLYARSPPKNYPGRALWSAALSPHFSFGVRRLYRRFLFSVSGVRRLFWLQKSKKSGDIVAALQKGKESAALQSCRH